MCFQDIFHSLIWMGCDGISPKLGPQRLLQNCLIRAGNKRAKPKNVGRQGQRVGPFVRCSQTASETRLGW